MSIHSLLQMSEINNDPAQGAPAVSPAPPASLLLLSWELGVSGGPHSPSPDPGDTQPTGQKLLYLMVLSVQQGRKPIEQSTNK